MHRERAQASIETAALLPLLVVLALCCWQAMLVGWTSISAEHAARAAAHAALTGDGLRTSALSALPGPMRAGLRLRREPHTVAVRVAVPQVVPGLSLDVTATAELVAR